MARRAPILAGIVLPHLLILCLPTEASAQTSSPERAVAERLSESLRTAPSARAASVQLERLWAGWDLVGPEPIVPTLEHLSREKRASPWVRDAARWHLAEAALRQGNPVKARGIADALGVVRRYLILGPLDNEGDGGIDRVWPPEEQVGTAIAVDVGVEGARREVSWREIEVADDLGRLRLSGYLHPTEEICAYALAFLELERTSRLRIAFSAGGASVLWINDDEVLRDPVYRDLHPDRFAFQVVLPAGTNRVMAKVCGDDEVIPGLLLRVTGPTGDGVDAGLDGRIASARRAPPEKSRGVARNETTPFTTWLGLAKNRRARPGDKALAARYLHLTGADDPADPIAPDLAASAADASEDRDTALLAAVLSPERNGARARLERLSRETPENALVLSALAEVISEGPDPQLARPILARLRKLAPASVVGAVLESELSARSGLPLTGLRRLESALELTGEVPALLETAADISVRSARLEDQERYLVALLEMRADSVTAHRDLAVLYRDRGDRARAVTHLDIMDRVGWDRLPDRIWAATTREQLGLAQRARESLRALSAQAPDHPEGWAALARLLAGLGQTREALEPLSRALELQPQDQGLSELRAHLLDLDPYEDEFIESPETFLARRGAGGGQHARWLLDLTVSRVHPNGLSSRFRQIAIEVLDEQGARGLRGHAIGFVPLEQQVTVRRARIHRRDGTIEEASGRFIQRMSDPHIRMYYDTRAEVIELPRLRPGDVVEYAYRVDDVASTNLMGDYFGDLVTLQGDEPRGRVSFVLIHPDDLEIHHEATELPGLSHSRACGEDSDDTCSLTWEATEVPALPREEHRPPVSELGARLSLSTYDDWDAIGRWYWGLIREQLVPDEGMRRLVDELVDGLESDEERVRAIHRWVVEHTRYVALEFGIHGYQPYPVTQVVDRGFGDCKDKASLLVTMLGLAGVEASIVLLRTRASGVVQPRPPSLAFFDHAIAYVPSLDRFLDGTAEQSGTTELPWMDQGVSALIVRTDGSSRLVTTPIDDLRRNSVRTDTEIALESEGSSVVRLRQSYRGHQAAGLRYRFQAAALREERLTESLSRSWPGLRLLEHRFHEIEDRERPVELSARFEAPSAVRADASRRSVEIARPQELTRRWARRSTRRTPLDLGGPPHRGEEERTINLPAGATVVRLPEALSIRSPFGSLEIEIDRSGRQIRIRTTLEIGRYRIEPVEYEEFRRFCRSVDHALERRLVIELS